MATIRVRYRNGESDESELRDQLPALDLAKHFAHAIKAEQIIGFPVKATHSDLPSDCGFASVRMSDVATWHMDGLVDSSDPLGPWLEAEADEGGAA